MLHIIDIGLRLVLSVVLGGIIGYQREVSEKPAGLRTHALVSLGSALIMVISIELSREIAGTDATRIAANVVAGIGFLGGGAIIRQGSIVRGLTTAASIWVVSGIGLAAGAGFYTASILATILILLTLTALKYVELRVVPAHRTVQMIALENPQQLGKIVSSLGEINVTVKTIEIEPLEDEGANLIQLSLYIPSEVDPNTVLTQLASTKGVSEVHWITRSFMGER